MNYITQQDSLICHNTKAIKLTQNFNVVNQLQFTYKSIAKMSYVT
jgi:hypothetical protein